MTEQQLALWELMAAALHKLLPIVEAMAEYETEASPGDTSYCEWADTLCRIVVLEEMLRPAKLSHAMN
jgi:hypothetical protein